jgi:DNA polymerase-1
VHDTNKSEYLRFSDAREYGLDSIAERRYPEFTGYKYIVVNEMLANVPDVPQRVLNGSLESKYTYIERNKLFNVAKLSLETLRLYNGADCHVTKLLDVDNYKHVNKALLKVYIDLSYVLQRMEPNGPWFDYAQNKKLERLFPGREIKLRRKLQKMLGNKEFNPASPQQVNAALYDILDLEYSGKGAPNTRKNTLMTLGRTHKFPLHVLDWRAAAKAGSTYVESYKICADMNDGRLRTSWWDTGTRTGRLSSGGGKNKGKINLQNIHNDTHVRNQCVADPRWRQVYNAIKEILTWAKSDEEAANEIEAWLRKNMPDFKTFLILDYGQVEVRVAAQLSGDENLIADCQSADIHTTVGVTMTGWKAEDIKNDHRTRTNTKNIHFAILYGSNVEGVYNYVVAKTPPDLEPPSREEIEGAFQRYFERYAGVRLFINAQREFAEANSYVETMFGMRQNLVIKGGKNNGDEEDQSSIEETDEDDGSRSSWWGNQAINGPVQGTAHQLLECALIRLQRYKKFYKMLNVPVLDVHDALYFAVNVLELVPATKMAKGLMEEGSLETVKADFPEIKWRVPIVTEAEAGLSLGCKVKLSEKTTPGAFLLDWFRKRRKQSIELQTELKKLPVVIEATATSE